MGKLKESYLMDIDENSMNPDEYFEHRMNNPFLDLEIKDAKIADRLEDIAIQNQIDKARGK